MTGRSKEKVRDPGTGCYCSGASGIDQIDLKTGKVRFRRNVLSLGKLQKIFTVEETMPEGVIPLSFEELIERLCKTNNG
jgi:hypothetical protein